MAYYYKLEEEELEERVSQNVWDKDLALYSNASVSSKCEPSIHHDFSKYVLIEFLDDFTPVKKLWELLGLIKNKAVIRKRLTADPHRLKCRRAVVICSNSENAKQIVNSLKGKTIVGREICTVVIEDLLADIKLFEKQIRKYGDLKAQEKLVYISNLNKSRKPAALVQFLNDKFKPFGTILSILVSEDVDGYAHGEAVVRFSYFSEAFAAELAYDECVVGKERFSVAMQHNILLCECDLRVRLRDGLKAYQNRIGVGPLFRSSTSSAKSSEHKIPFTNAIASKSENIGTSLNNSFSSTNSHKVNSSIQQCESSIELVRGTPVNESKDHSSANTANVFYVPKTNSLLKGNNKAPHYCNEGVCVSKTCTCDVLNAYKLDELHIANDSLDNSNQSWSSKIIGWVRSFVAKDNPLLLEKDISNHFVNDSNEIIFNSQNDTDGTEKVNSVPYLLLATNVSDRSETNTLKSFITTNVRKAEESRQISVHKEANCNKSSMQMQNSSNSYNDVENCSPLKHRKISKCRSSQQTVNAKDGNFRSEMLVNCIDKRTNAEKSGRRTRRGVNSSKLSSFNSYNIMTRSKKNKSTLTSSSTFNQDVDTSASIRKNGLSINNKSCSKKKNIQPVCFSASNYNNIVINTHEIKPIIASNCYNLECSTPTQKESATSLQNSSASSIVTRTLLYAGISQLTPTMIQDLSGNSNITRETILDSIDSTVSSSTRACIKDTSLESVVERFHSSQCSTLENTLEQKHFSSSRLNRTYTKLSPAVISCRYDQQNQNLVLPSNDYEPENCTVNSSSDSPIRAWLKEHLLCSVNNGVTTNEDNPEGIMFATMSKDILISVGCSHMTCDVCYPGASNLIFGF